MTIISSDKAYLVGFAVEAVLYGLYLVLFFASVAFLTWRRRSDFVNWPMLVMSCLLFCASTIHFGINFDNIIMAFITRRNAPGGPLALIVSPHFVLRINIMFSINNFLGDTLLIYRCWLVWQKNWFIIVLPVLLMLTYTLSAIIGLYYLANLGSGHGASLPASVRDFGTVSFILSLCLNATVTALIAGRIYHMARKATGILPRSRSRQYTDIIGVIVESGAIFCAAQIMFVVLWRLPYRISSIGAHPVSQLYCIVPTLIIVRVGLGVSSENTTMKPTENSSTRYAHSAIKFTRSTHTTSDTQFTSVKPDLEMSHIGKYESRESP